MRDMIRVLVLGTGRMGSEIARLVLDKPGLELVGAYARRHARAGMDLGHAIGLGRSLGVPLGNDLAAVIEQSQPEIAIQATCSRIVDARQELETLVRHGVHVISIAEQMVYPACSSPAFARDLRSMAVTRGVAVLGTGINPGFVLDLLIITLTGVCADVRCIVARRVNDLSPYGPSVLAAQGVGMSPGEFNQGLAEGRVAGHYGFAESIHLIAAALGWHIGRIEETREPIIARVRRETDTVVVEPGRVAGCSHQAVAYIEEQPVISLMHPQQLQPEREGVATEDVIEILGTPHIRLAGSPEIPGGQGTAALAVNMIPRVLSAPPGLHSMPDLPVPAALMEDARLRLRGSGLASRHG
jgi:4-hydroxy-tetrahydrodipicolinate reductase